MLLTEFDETTFVESIKSEGWEEGRKEGLEEREKRGEQKGKMNTLVSLVKRGMLSLENAADMAGLPIDKFKELMEM